MSAQSWSFADAFRWTSRRHSSRTAWIQEGTVLTYDELSALAEVIRVTLLDHAGRGDRVALLGHNSAAYVAAFAAAAAEEIILVPLNARLSPCEHDYLVNDAGCKAILADASSESAAREITGTMPLLLLEQRIEPTPAAAGMRAASAEEGAILALMYTAATDGRARGAMMTQRAFAFQMPNMTDGIGLKSSDVVAIFTPLSHAAALSYALAALHVGATCVSLPVFDAAEAAAAIDDHKISVLPAFAPMPQNILKTAERDARSLSSLRLVIARDVPETISAFFAEVPELEWQIGNFGQTETQGMAVAGTRLNAEAFNAGQPTGGVPLPLTQIRTIDCLGEDVGVDEVGEIIVRGPNTAAGYWNRPDETAEATRDGWWHTGDRGRIDIAGLLHFVDRSAAKNLIKTGGENVYPEEVEEVLRRHPAVADVAVFGIPDPVWLEAVTAVVVVRSDVPVSAEELITFCKSAIASYKKPRFVEFVDHVPRLADGTLDRAAVKITR